MRTTTWFRTGRRRGHDRCRRAVIVRRRAGHAHAARARIHHAAGEAEVTRGPVGIRRGTVRRELVARFGAVGVAVGPRTGSAAGRTTAPTDARIRAVAEGAVVTRRTVAGAVGAVRRPVAVVVPAVVAELLGAADEGILVVDTSATPHAVDIVGQAGPNAGKTLRAIFRIRGDLLQLCYEVGDAPARPSAFVSEQGSMALTVRYRRVQ